MSAILDLTADMPIRHLQPGDVLYDRGDAHSVGVAVLIDGYLSVDLDGLQIDHVSQPGAFVGEIGALLGRARTADVVARAPSTVRVIGDPPAFFASHPEVALELARQLAGKLHRLMAYLGDVREQYSDSDGHLAMIDAVLGRLATRPPIDIEPGSDRSPDY